MIMAIRQPFTFCYYTPGGLELPSLSQGATSYHELGGRIRVLARTKTQLFDQARRRAFVKQALAADFIIVRLHGGKASCPVFDELTEALGKLPPKHRPRLHIHPSSGDEDAITTAARHSDDFGTPAWKNINAYLENSGHLNFQYLLRYLYNLLFDEALDCPKPLKLPDDGIYHPDYKGVIDLERYLAEKVDPARPTVGLWFHQAYWVNYNLAYIDALIREIEKQKANVIPVFHLRFKDRARGNRGSVEIVEEYFLDERGETRIDVLLNPMLFSLSLIAPEYRGLLSRLGVPCLQAMMSMSSYRDWKDSDQGMSCADVSFSAAQPEFDGNLITVPVATREEEKIDPVTGGLLSRYHPIPERCEKLVRLSLNWARLRHIPNPDRRVAIIFHHYPPRDDRIGCAAGLDSFASVKKLLDKLREQGYRLGKSYASGDELATDLLEKMTADRRWLTPERMAARAVAQAGPELYRAWNEELPEKVREKMASDWGPPPGELFVHNGRLHFAGLVNGNIFLTIQPPRGFFENIDKIYHDPKLSTPHHYLTHYRWIRDVFKADAVIHVGKHGSLEWLPGKALGLSGECYPDLAIMELPNLYPYIINDPSEGTQAKRRSYAAIIDHLTPVFTNADLYEELAAIENLLNDYQAALREDPGKIGVLEKMIREAVVTAHLDRDLGLDEATITADFPAFLEKLHDYLHELSDTMINDGLHTLGEVPKEKRLVEFLAQLTRLDNGPVPSLRENVIRAMGFDYDELLENRGRIRPEYDNRSGGQVIAAAHDRILKMLSALAAAGFAGEKAAPLVAEFFPEARPAARAPIRETLAYICDDLVPRIKATGNEIDSLLTGLKGGFIEPGPSGAPTRGQAEILPTGRNFYSVDPNKIPTPAAWEVGKRLGDALLERYLAEEGRYPDSIGILVYGGPTMRSRGDDIAEIYYLMGVKPIWQKGSGNVVGLEVIPIEELGRPRLDVTPRVSGFFRDAFPNLMERIDEAVALVSALKEPAAKNFLRRNVLADIREYRRRGLNEEEARREATFRVFGCPPGTYGAGVSELVEAKSWETRDDLGNNYINYSAHAYGRGAYGLKKADTFRRLLGRMEVTVKNEDSREYDMMSCTDYYNYYGGLIAAAETVRGTAPLSIMGDASDPQRVKIRTTAEEARHVLRSRLVNPRWLEGMKRHGYKGAGDISHMMDVVLGWDATAGVIEDWMYESLARKFALDPEMKEWMEQVNPHARQNILDKLLEAIARGMWRAEPEIEAELRDAYLEIEGELEERCE